MVAVALQADFNPASVMVDVPIELKLPGQNGSWRVAVDLSVAPRFRIIKCGAVKLLKSCRSHSSAAAAVSQPQLLLPPSAVNDAASDVAETCTFAVELSSPQLPDGSRGRPMVVRLPSKKSATLAQTAWFSALFSLSWCTGT